MVSKEEKRHLTEAVLNPRLLTLPFASGNAQL
jgi:hypothetical protein